MNFKLFVRHRLEELSTFIVMGTHLFGGILLSIIYLSWLFSGNFYLRILWLAYTIFWIYDRNSESNNHRGQGLKFLRDLSLYQYVASYFPVRLVKTVDLPANTNYLFASFPHGILSYSMVMNFGTNASNFKKMFPGIRSKMCTINVNFYFPLYREIILGYGMLSANATSIMNHLTQSNNKNDTKNSDGYTSNAVIVLVGGAKEAYYAKPGDYILVLKERKGFVKLAIKSGCSLVPVFSFGENEVYNQIFNPPGSVLKYIQDAIKNVTGVIPIYFYGRFGIIPYRKPITMVIGSPIPVEKCLKPSDEMIQELHDKFVQELRNLFETHKWKFLENAENVQLIIK